jgi:glycosyltransferase involved in cell wall biosynthesis
LRSAQALQRKGIKQVFSPLKNSPAESRARTYGFELLSFDDFSSLSTLLNLRQYSQKINPSHIICYGGQEDFLCRFLPQKIRKIRFYGQELPEYSTLARIKFSSFFEQHFYKLAPCFKIENQLKQVSNFKNIKTITLGLDSNAYLNAKESQKSERPIICIFGRLDPVKGHREFLKIFKKAMSLFPAHARPLSADSRS